MAAAEICTEQTLEDGVVGRIAPRPPIFRSLVTQMYAVFLLACHSPSYGMLTSTCSDFGAVSSLSVAEIL